jgi:hypothetical protein
VTAIASLVGSDLRVGVVEVAFSEVERNLVERALLPLFRLRQPEYLTLGIQHGALSANKFLAANFNELFHQPHSSVKANFWKTA